MPLFKTQSGELIEARLQSEAARPTFKAAKARLLDYLVKQGWTVQTNLKIPHATNPSGDLRLWFKGQSIHYSIGADLKNFRSARSTFVDVRAMSPAEFVKDVEASARKPMKTYF